jgi:hypothetical protein
VTIADAMSRQGFGKDVYDWDAARARRANKVWLHTAGSALCHESHSSKSCDSATTNDNGTNGQNSKEDSKFYKVKVSYLELYQESIRDLLQDHQAVAAIELPIREDKSGTITVPGLMEVSVSKVEDILE